MREISARNGGPATVHKRVKKHKLKRSAEHKGPAVVQSQIREVNWAHDLNLYKIDLPSTNERVQLSTGHEAKQG
jgi:hypothetical protein